MRDNVSGLRAEPLASMGFHGGEFEDECVGGTVPAFLFFLFSMLLIEEVWNKNNLYGEDTIITDTASESSNIE